MIRKFCNNGKFVITTTQMLDSMNTNPRPIRAEVTDISNAIIDGTSVIMLSGETASGKHPIEAVRNMNSISLETERYLDLTELSSSLRGFKKADVTDPVVYKQAIDYSVSETVTLMKAAGIICITNNGRSSNILSGYRAKIPIFAITTNEQVTRHLSLVWNVQPVYLESYTDPQDLIQKGIEKFKEMKFLIPGDTVVICGGQVDDKKGRYATLVSFVMIVK